MAICLDVHASPVFFRRVDEIAKTENNATLFRSTNYFVQSIKRDEEY